MSKPLYKTRESIPGLLVGTIVKFHKKGYRAETEGGWVGFPSEIVENDDYFFEKVHDDDFESLDEIDVETSSIAYADLLARNQEKLISTVRKLKEEVKRLAHYEDCNSDDIEVLRVRVKELEDYAYEDIKQQFRKIVEENE